MEFVNLTPHAINFKGMVIPPSGNVARVSQVRETSRELGEGFETVSTGFVEMPKYWPCGRCDECSSNHDCQNMPVMIVSAMVGAAVAGLPYKKQPHNPVVSPGTLVRDESGNVVGCTTFTVWSV